MCGHAQFNRWAVDPLHFTELNRSLNFMVVTEGGKEATFVYPHCDHRARSLNLPDLEIHYSALG